MKEPQPRIGQKPNYLQQEILDKAIEDGERKLMNRVYQDKYEKLLTKVKQHNQECDWECNARAKYCIDYLAVGRRCSDCPKQWKINIEENK